LTGRELAEGVSGGPSYGAIQADCTVRKISR
jgi:hypothetical protein